MSGVIIEHHGQLVLVDYFSQQGGVDKILLRFVFVTACSDVTYSVKDGVNACNVGRVALVSKSVWNIIKLVDIEYIKHYEQICNRLVARHKDNSLVETLIRKIF